MLTKIKAWLYGAGAFVLAILAAAFYRRKYKSEKKAKEQAQANEKKQSRIKEAYAAGEKKYNETINKPVSRGRFTK
jgi:sRNA-binding protein